MSKIRPENIRNSAFYYPMIIFKRLLKIQFNLDIDSFKCSEVFGVSIGHMRLFLDFKIYQILSYYPEYYDKIIEFSNEIMSEEKKYMFLYFMTRTYEELYKCYVEGNVNFPCIPNGTLRICHFTLYNAIKEKKKELEGKKKDNEFIETYISIFKNISESMIKDLKDGKNERVEKKEKRFIPKVYEKFEVVRTKFI